MSTKFWLFSLIISLLSFASCKKNTLDLPVSETPTATYVKFINACATCPASDAYWNEQKITASASQGLGYTPVASFPSLGYAALTAGQYQMRFNRYTIADSVLASSSLTLETGKYYTVILGDTLQTPSITALEDVLIDPTTDSSARVRFANFISRVPNNVDLEVVRKTDSLVISPIAYRKASNWLSNRVSSSFDTFYVRPVGSRLAFSTTATPWIRINNLNVTHRRNYTIVVSGIWGRTGTVIPRVQIFSNR